jgi:hypothetical protein
VGGADLTSIRGSFQKHDVEIGMNEVGYQRNRRVLHAARNNHQLQPTGQGHDGNVMGRVRKGLAPFPAFVNSALESSGSQPKSS